MLTVLTGRRSRKAAAVRAAGRFSLCAQDDSPPYRYVSVQWPVISEEELDSVERLAMARRYLGTAAGRPSARAGMRSRCLGLGPGFRQDVVVACAAGSGRVRDGCRDVVGEGLDHRRGTPAHDRLVQARR
jgi:hypothetical protein